MTRIAIRALALALLFLGQDAWSQQFQSKAEYDAYVALYNEQAAPERIRLGEIFLNDYPDSEAAPIAYQILVLAHFEQRNWDSVSSVAARFDRDFPDANEETKSFIYRRAMAAAQQEQNPGEIIRYGNKILEIDRTNLGALLTLPPVILDNLPTAEPARSASLSRAFELANRARLEAQTFFANESSDQQVQVFSNIHMYLGRVYDARGDFERAAAEYLRVLEYDPRHPLAYLHLGLAYQRDAARISTLLQDQNATGPAGDTSSTTSGSSDLEERVIAGLDRAIDALARAVALGGQAAGPARVELERLYRSRNEDSIEGLEALIQEKRNEFAAAVVETPQG